jgi:fatty acid omega-hydroxylase
MFSTRALKEDMAPVFIKYGDVLMSVFDRFADEKKTFDIQDYIFRYTISAFAEIGFGEDVQAITKNPAEVPFIAAFDTAQYRISDRFVDPFWKVERTIQKLVGESFAIFKREWEILRAIRIVNEFAKKVTAQRERELVMGKTKKDLVSRFLQDATERHEEISEQYLRDIIINFLIAGRDTTACAVTWMLYLLCQNPHEEAKVVAEVRQAMQAYEKKEVSAYELATSLKYTEAALLETLRLHPSVPMDVKTAAARDTLPDGTVVPAGTLVAYSPWLSGRSEELWGKDAAEYKPSRWLTEESHSQYKYITFNAGPRLCLGKHVALLEGVLLVAQILNRFSVQLAPNRKVTYLRNVTHSVKNGLHVTLIRR